MAWKKKKTDLRQEDILHNQTVEMKYDALCKNTSIHFK